MPIADHEARKAYDRERYRRKKMGLPPPSKLEPKTKAPRRREIDAEQENRKMLARFAELCIGEPEPAEGCAVCGKPRRPERSARYAKGCAELDAFCSTECARQFHGQPYPALTNRGRPAKEIHGTKHRYRQGCRCEACVDEFRRLDREYQRKRRKRLREQREEQAA